MQTILKMERWSYSDDQSVCSGDLSVCSGKQFKSFYHTKSEVGFQSLHFKCFGKEQNASEVNLLCSRYSKPCISVKPSVKL